MKRSEMLTKIEEFLDGEQDVYWNSILAKHLLEFLEKEGMCPPETKLIDSFGDENLCLEWEPEDEA